MFKPGPNLNALTNKDDDSEEDQSFANWLNLMLKACQSIQNILAISSCGIPAGIITDDKVGARESRDVNALDTL